MSLKPSPRMWLFRYNRQRRSVVGVTRNVPERAHDRYYQPDMLWLCECGNFIENGLHCPRCLCEPPWGCPCEGCQNPEPPYDNYDEELGYGYAYEDDRPDLPDEAYMEIDLPPGPLTYYHARWEYATDVPGVGTTRVHTTMTAVLPQNLILFLRNQRFLSASYGRTFVRASKGKWEERDGEDVTLRVSVISSDVPWIRKEDTW